MSVNIYLHDSPAYKDFQSYIAALFNTKKNAKANKTALNLYKKATQGGAASGYLSRLNDPNHFAALEHIFGNEVYNHLFPEPEYEDGEGRYSTLSAKSFVQKS